MSILPNIQSTTLGANTSISELELQLFIDEFKRRVRHALAHIKDENTKSKRLKSSRLLWQIRAANNRIRTLCYQAYGELLKSQLYTFIYGWGCRIDNTHKLPNISRESELG